MSKITFTIITNIFRFIFFAIFYLNYGAIAVIIVAIYGGIEYALGYNKDEICNDDNK